MNPEPESISDEALRQQEELVGPLMSGPDAPGEGEPVEGAAGGGERAASDARAERIVERAKYQAVLRDTGQFLFVSLGAALAGLLNGLTGSVPRCLRPADDGASRPREEKNDSAEH